MPASELRQQIVKLTAEFAGKELNSALEDWLNQEHGVGRSTYRKLEQSCREGVDAGWLCEREAGGIGYGRIFKPAAELQNFSVDVVNMKDVAGPHHSHPGGEIDLVMPLDSGALFDKRPAGWLVYAPGSAHYPTVTNGRALVLYLLPDGSIEFTR
jgi:hypothetical protein